MSLISKIFAGGADAIVKTVSDTVDRFITTPDEKAAIKAELEKEVNRQMEALQAQSNKIEKAYLADTQSARTREAEFVKSTGHTDWMMTTIGILVMVSFMSTVWYVATQKLPEGSEHLLINAMGILEGMVLAVVGYYYGSSAGSRIKDMRGK